MGEFVERFCKDVKPYRDHSFEEWYNYVKSIPYVEDVEAEIIARPLFIMEDQKADCKKKSILIASWCMLNEIPCRFVVMSNRISKQPHHIFTEVYDLYLNEWIPADATYNSNRLGSKEKETYREEWEFVK